MRFRIVKLIHGEKFAIKDYLRRYLYVTKIVADTPQYLAPKCKLEIAPQSRIWTMWWQDDIPEIIQMCLDSILCFYPQTVIITEKNLSQYLDVPPHIMDKLQRGIISFAHFSDYVRVSLLDVYGGTWIDASCLMLGQIPEFILKQPFFILQSPNKSDVSNFFIHAMPNNYLIRCIRVFLEEYWCTENRAIDYFFFQLFVSMVCARHLGCKTIWSGQIPYLNSNIKYLSYFLYRNADLDTWQYLMRNSFMYKVHHRSQIAKDNPRSWYYFLLDLYRTGQLPRPVTSPTFKTMY